MKRRDLIALLSGLAPWRLEARAQQLTMPVIGFLSAGSAQGYAARVASFHQGLNETGYVEGRNVAIEYHWADGHNDLLPALAAYLVHRQVSVIVAAGGTSSAKAAKAATATIPIVFVVGGDPEQAGLVASLGRPGGNVTGVAELSEVLITKRLELMRELVPKAEIFGFLLNPTNPNVDIRVRDIHAAAGLTGMQVRILHAARESEFNAVFESATRQHLGALIVQADPLFNKSQERLVALAARHAIAVAYDYRDFVVAGGLISYGASQDDSYRQVGIYTGRILQGAKPADLPVLRPSKFDMVVNLKTADSLGLTVPPSVLTRASEIID